MRPAVWIIEVGEMPCPTRMAELMEKINEVLNTNGAAYTMQPLRNLTPALCGIPARRPRTFIIGWRNDVAPAGQSAAPLADLVGNPMSVDVTFTSFLGLRAVTDWSRVGQFPSRAEMEWQTRSGCQCRLDPWVQCPVHTCKCGSCGDDGVRCAWRGRLVKFIEAEGLAPVIARSSGAMTYLDVLEINGGLGPDLHRKRVYTNLVAISPRSQPLNETLMVVDLAQNPPLGSLHCEGDTPTCTASTDLWVFQFGMALGVQHYSALMGLDLSKVTLTRKMTDPWIRQRLGLAVHIGNFGIVLLAAVTPPLTKLLC